MPSIIKVLGKIPILKVAILFLSFFMMIGGVSLAGELTEDEFFGGGFEEEERFEKGDGFEFEEDRNFEFEDQGEDEFFREDKAFVEDEVFVEKEAVIGDEFSFQERKNFFDSKINEFNFTDNRPYTSSPRKRERLRDTQNRLELGRSYFKGIIDDFGYITTSPSRWDRTDWMTAGLVVGATGFFWGLDEEIRDFFEDRRSSTTDDLAEIFEPFGNGFSVVPGLAAFWIFGHFDENYKAKRSALIAMESYIISGVYANIIKVTMGRHRPSTGNSSTTFDGFTTTHKSFPSGHTTTSFAVATVIANEYEDVPYIKPISYGLATLTGLSRINDEKHWASDVFFGAALGYFTSKTLLHLHNNKKGQHFTIYPRVDNNGGGLVLSRRF